MDSAGNLISVVSSQQTSRVMQLNPSMPMIFFADIVSATDSSYDETNPISKPIRIQIGSKEFDNLNQSVEYLHSGTLDPHDATLKEEAPNWINLLT